MISFRKQCNFHKNTIIGKLSKDAILTRLFSLTPKKKKKKLLVKFIQFNPLVSVPQKNCAINNS